MEYIINCINIKNTWSDSKTSGLKGAPQSLMSLVKAQKKLVSCLACVPFFNNQPEGNSDARGHGFQNVAAVPKSISKPSPLKTCVLQSAKLCRQHWES